MLHLFNVTYQYPSGEGIFQATFTVRNGEFVFLVGPSGAGKSTLLRLIHLELLPQQGHIVLDSFNTQYIRPKDIPLVRRKVGVVFQDFKLLRDRNVYENVAFALLATGTPRRRVRKRVLEILKEVGLSHKRFKYPDELSGGEQQRVAIARALANEPYVLLADEPTGNLDQDTALDILRLLERINARGTAILMATHNRRLAEVLGKRIIRIEGGRILV
jgi:cell division transport system ATP-binding protein